MMKYLMVLLCQDLILMNDKKIFFDFHFDLVLVFDYLNLYQYLLNQNQFDYFLNKIKNNKLNFSFLLL